MDVLGVPREAAGVSFQSARPTSFAPGEAPRGAWGRVGRAAPGPGSPQEVQFGGRRPRLARLEGAGRRERKGAAVGGSDPGGPGAYYKNFVVKSKGSEKKSVHRHAPSRPRLPRGAQTLRSGFIAECSAPESAAGRRGRCLWPGAGLGWVGLRAPRDPSGRGGSWRGSGPERGCH